MSEPSRLTQFLTEHSWGIRFRVGAYAKLFGGSYKELRTFLLFVGHPRSGHTLISAMLDAHRNVVLGNEVDVLKHVLLGTPRCYLYEQLIRSAEAFTEAGSTWQGYSYAIPGQWQGCYETLRVLGDKQAAATIRKYGGQPDILIKLRQLVGSGIKIKFIHMIRNPFDNIATIWRRQSPAILTLGQCADDHFGRLAAIMRLKYRIPNEDIFDIRLEDLIKKPVESLAALCGFIGVDCPQDYLRDCASIVLDSPRKSSHDAYWPPEMVSSIQQRIGEYPFLNGYSFES